jgi:PAS domain S-box-containing protein
MLTPCFLLGKDQYIFPQPASVCFYAPKIWSQFCRGRYILETPKATTELEKELIEYKKAVEASTDIIAAVDHNYTYLFANQAFLTYRKKNREQVVGHTITEVLGQEAFTNHVKEKVDECLQGQNVSYQAQFTYPDLGKRQVEISYTPIRDENQGITSVVAVIRDITEYTRIQKDLDETARQLAQKNRELEELNTSKDKFFSIIAHDLRNPLTSFISFGEMLHDVSSLDKDTFNRLTSEFRSSASYLLTLLDNLLTWARIQRGLIISDPFPLELNEVVGLCMRQVLPAAQAKRIEIHNLVSPEILVMADYYMLDRVIHNLLTNAVKFSNFDSTIEICAEQQGEMIKAFVSDTGIGIPPEILPDLFKIGIKNSQPGTAGEKGTGIGLILCKEFIEKNLGKIWVESIPNKGSIFFFTLPRA